MEVTKLLLPFTSKYPDYTVIYLTMSGSRLYGTDTQTSDTDYKGIFIPPIRDILLKQDIEHWTQTTGNNSSANAADDVDIQLWSVHKFLHLVAKGETGALDLLFSMKRVDTHFLYKWPVHAIDGETPHLLHKNVHSFVGYCVGQSKKYNIKGKRYYELTRFIDEANDYNVSFTTIVELGKYKYIDIVMAPGPRGSKGNVDIPYIEVLGKKFDISLDRGYILDKLIDMREQYGNRAKAAEGNPDWKSLSHAVRVLLEVRELLSTHTITFPLLDADYIKSIKSGTIALEDVIKFIETTMVEVDELMLTSTLPDKPDKELTDTLLLTMLE